MHPAPKSLSLLLCVCLLACIGMAQEVSISITPEIDSLQARLLRSPNERALQTRLIDNYILTFNPELALLEILNAENAADVRVKGLTQMSLEQVQPALFSLRQSYLLAPSDETLVLIAVLDYAHGNSRLGFSLLQRLRSRSPGLSIDLLKIYERFYLNDRKIVAGAAADALRDIDPLSYQSYFPKPVVSILSPGNEYATESAQTSVIFEVRHSRPVRNVELRGIELYERGNEKIGSASEEYHQNFSKLIDLQEGENIILAEATDVFGNKGADTVIVNGLNFNRPADWVSAASDSLRKLFQYFRNYVPDSVLVGEKSALFRALIASSAGMENPEGDEAGLFLYELLTNPVSGFVQPSNAKLLLKDRMKAGNISLVMKDWLLKGATFQSVSIVYLSGKWKVDTGRWDLHDAASGVVEMKGLLSELKRVATAGTVLLIDGNIDRRDLFEGELRQLVESAAVPIEVMLLPVGKSWPTSLLSAIAAVPGGTSRDSLHADISTGILGKIVVGSSHITTREQSVVIARNPVRSIRERHEGMVALLRQKLSADKVATQTRTKILDFCRDWRRYHEMARFLSNDLTLSDFVVRVDEYKSRSTNAEGK